MQKKYEGTHLLPLLALAPGPHICLSKYITKKEHLARRKEKWKVPLPFEDRLFLDRVRTRSLVRKLGVSFDLLPTEQLAVVENLPTTPRKTDLRTQRPARRAAAARRRQGRQRDSKPVAGLYFTEYHSAVRQ